MNRQEFLFSLLALATTPVWAKSDISIPLLTGKGNPNLLYGLLPEAARAFEAMKKEASKKGVKLHITSAYRNYDRQMEIWNNKFDRYSANGLKGEAIIHKITEFSAMPGTSRHHWGTDADILDLSVLQPKNPLEPSHYVSPNGIYHKMFDWMQHNSERFGFYEAYTDDNLRPGYEFEPWHYSYKIIAKDYLKAYNETVQLSDVKSPLLKGNDLITENFFRNYLKNYVNGVNHYLQV
jgi:hypothetical protein